MCFWREAHIRFSGDVMKQLKEPWLCACDKARYGLREPKEKGRLPGGIDDDD